MKNAINRRGRSAVIESMESRVLFTGLTATVLSGYVDVSYNAQQSITVDFSKCGGSVTVTGDNVVQTQTKGGVDVTGTNLVFTSVDVNTTTDPDNAMLKINGIGFGNNSDNWPVLQGFNSTVALNLINMHDVNLTGSVNIFQAQQATLEDIADATISAAIARNFQAHNILNSVVGFNAPLRRLSVNEFLATTPGSSSLNGWSVGSIRDKGDFSPDVVMINPLHCCDPIGCCDFSGSLSGTWDITGGIRRIRALEITSAFSATAGEVGDIHVKQDFSGTLTAYALRNLNVGVDLSGANLILINPWAFDSWDLGKAMIGNAIYNSHITATGSIDLIHTMYTDYSWITAGVSSGFTFGQDLTASDFTANATIKTFFSDCPSMHNQHFAGSYVGAYSFGNVHIGNINTNFGGQPIGLAAHDIGKLSFLLDSGKYRPSFSNLKIGSDFADRLQSLNIGPSITGDFHVYLPISLTF
jgi:hypothetical protein